MFLYTKNDTTIKRILDAGGKLLKKREDGVSVYALSPTFMKKKINFDEDKDTWVSNKLTF